jgi:ubiquinone biosynthesis protein
MFEIISFLTLVVTAAVVAFFARRILGAPVGWPRSILIGMLMLSLLGSVLPRLSRTLGLANEAGEVDQPVLAGVLFGLILAWAFLLSIAALVLLELIVPTGSIASPRRLVRGLRMRWRRTRRYLQVLAIATRHGLGGFLRRSRSAAAVDVRGASLPQAVRRALDEAGVTFIKAGQMLATRPDLLPPSYVRELGMLQTFSEPLSWSDLEPVLAATLRRPPTEVFAEIDHQPLASASVGQVHAAVLHDGQPVVIKIQKPAARAQVTADLDIVLRLARRLQTSTTWGKSLGVMALAEGFADSLAEELDYTIEADNMAAVAAASRADELAVPEAYRELSGPTVLVMQRLAGTPVADADELLAGMPPARRAATADRLLAAVLRQVLVGGVFHADLHPGNVLVDATGILGLLDFGSVGRLDDGSREAMAMLLLAIERDSSLTAADALLDLLDAPADELDERSLEREIGQLMTRSRAGISRQPELFGQLFRLVSRHGFAVPPQIAAAFRTLAELENTLRRLDPELDLVLSTRRQAGDLLAERLSPDSVRSRLESELLKLVPVLSRLPRRINKLSESLDEGRLSVNVRLLANSRDRDFLLGLTDQVIVAVLAAAATIAAILLITAPSGPLLASGIGLYPILGYGLLFIGCVLALRALVLIFRRSWLP